VVLRENAIANGASSKTSYRSFAKLQKQNFRALLQDDIGVVVVGQKRVE
jgi:hypothetical protein